MTPLLLDFLAAFRLTRLITADSILDGPRDALVKMAYGNSDEANDGEWADFAMADPQAPPLAVLVTCRWCMGWWCALAVVIARRRFPRAWAPIAEALAFSAGAALLAGLED